MSQEELSEQAGLGLKYINQLETQNESDHSQSRKSDCCLKLDARGIFNFNSLEATTDRTDNLLTEKS